MIPGQLHLFLIWSFGRVREREILDDLASRFELLDLVEVEWPPERFSLNLTRFYGQALPPGSGKERHCGTGPFLVAVVRDPAPAYAVERHRGRMRVVNANAIEAKERYRGSVGGGHRVHASVQRSEFEHDLFLLLGRTPEHYAEVRERSGAMSELRGELRGGDGWAGLEELVTALRVTVRHVRIRRELGGGLFVLSDDPWWVAVVANGRPGLDDPTALRHEVTVAGASVQLELGAFEATPKEGVKGIRAAAKRVRAAGRMLRLRFSNHRGGIALVYHGIEDDPGHRRYELVPALSVEQLADQVGHLRRWYRIVAASELPAAVEGRRLGQRLPVALTFDDDLISHLEVAAPVLRAVGAPATFFLCGASLDTPHSFWWEDLQELVDLGLLDGVVPELSEADIDETTRDDGAALHRIATAIEELSPAERAGNIEPALRAARPAGSSARGLSREEVSALGRDFEIGFHTRRHDRLPPLDDESLAAALEAGRSDLEEAARQPLDTISYPHGRADARVAKAAAAAGYRVGLAGSSGSAPAAGDSLLLRRYELRETGADFAAAVAWLLTR